MIDLLSKIVFKIRCGGDSGTGFMVNNHYALSVFHNIIDHQEHNIEVSFDDNAPPIVVTLDETIDEYYKKLDIALLKFPKQSFSDGCFIPIIDRELKNGDKWLSRGFPQAKSDTGENLTTEVNKINQVLSSLQRGKIDLHLDFDKKLSSYKGISGSPVIVNKSIVGIINSQLTENSEAKELEALSVKNFKDLLRKNGIRVISDADIDSDKSGTRLWNDTKISDIRNIEDKLNDVCPNFNGYKAKKYFRDIASGQAELERYNERDIAAMKFRIFEKCQDELIDFVSNKQEDNIREDEIVQLIDKYTNRAENIIHDKAKTYKYPLLNRDILRKIVLELINECYLSFDKQGIYE